VDLTDAPHLINECRTIEENCTYTGEAHFIIAPGLEWWSRFFKYVPIAGSVISGALLAMGYAQWLGWVALLSGVVTAWATAMDVDRRARDHADAGRRFTMLKHDARALWQTYAPEITREEFYRETRRLAERYNQIVVSAPQTTREAFERASKRIKAGVYTPDFVRKPESGRPPEAET
jgi:hypothetical protein